MTSDIHRRKVGGTLLIVLSIYPAKPNVPDGAWSTDEIWLLRATYRTRDLQAVRIEGEPVPSAEASGMQTWTWQSNEPLLRPVLECCDWPRVDARNSGETPDEKGFV